MKKPHQISIPTPCYEDWDMMTPNSLGSFCKSCSKTVVDFTTKSPDEIKAYLLKNQGEKTCGRFRESQLDSIIIEIPREVLFNQISHTKIFLLALLVCMGTTLFSCSTPQKKQKIEKVILIDSAQAIKPRIDSLQNLTDATKTDDAFIATPVIPEEIIITTGIVCSIEDEIIPIDSMIEAKDSLDDPPPLLETDLIVRETSKNIDTIPESEPILFGMINETAPKFKSQKPIDGLNDKQVFTRNMLTYINSNFNRSFINHLPSGKYSIRVNFSINEKGDVEDVQVKTKFENLTQHIKEFISQLPKFIPGTQGGKPIKVKYTLPIHFIVE